MAQKLILVAGATGNQGRALIHALALGAPGTDFHVLALTRTPSSPAAARLAAQYAPHLTVVQGNLDAPQDVRRLFAGGGIWGVFCVLAFPGLGANADGEERQGKTLADISAEYGVSCFVYSSVERGGEYHDDHAQLDRRAKVLIERHVRMLGEAKGLPWTILRPGFFMENYDGMVGSVAVGVLKKGLRPETTNQLVATEDIGHVAAAIFQSPQNYSSQILVVVGEVSTMAQQLDAYTRATGKQLPSIPGFLARALIGLNSHTKALIADIERVCDAGRRGLCPEVAEQSAAARRAYPEMKSFREWAERRAGTGTGGAQKKGWNQVSLGRLAAGKQ
ncbi:NAD(P)-binding protein [Mycena maculata]|uniref:NAD(P)-binding protein n=1 Tax=Mycena maculata TaxID=230809 RepID=A0AAD7MTY0_9AGAR|nr:NAD(P)-binding protein [Mycena maculata]